MVQCEIGLVGKDMGGSSMSALVSTISCAAALDRFPLVAGTEVHRDRHQLGPFRSF
jgi:hypothetical protein